MSIAAGASILALPDRIPELDDTAFVADGARIVGAVSLGPGASVWYNAVLRGDSAPIIIGPGSNVQDNVSIHVDAGHPVVVGSQVSIGHNAVVHGCTIGDGSLIGMGAVVLSGAVIGEGCLIAGGAVVLGGTEVPPGSWSPVFPRRCAGRCRTTSVPLWWRTRRSTWSTRRRTSAQRKRKALPR